MIATYFKTVEENQSVLLNTHTKTKPNKITKNMDMGRQGSEQSLQGVLGGSGM